MHETSAALIDQLVYIDNFTVNQDTPNLDVDGQLSLDLAAFADDSFIFADEEKPDHPVNGDDDKDFHSSNENRQDPLPVSFQGLSPSSNSIEGNWFHHDDLMPMNDASSHKAMDSMGADARGHQLTSTLNDKIQSAKRNKSQSHNVHDPVPDQLVHRTTSDRNNVLGPHVSGLEPRLAPSHLLVDSSSASQRDLHHEQVSPENKATTDGIPDLSGVPKFPVPPGAKSSLKRAGLTPNQIDLLSALIAQHQTTLSGGVSGNERLSGTGNSNNNIPDRVDPRDEFNSPASNYSSESSNVSSSLLSQPHSDMYASVDLPTPNVDSDKRRRNTAASARFRVKKKMKERDMEEKIKQLTKAVKSFEMKIDDLEMENRLLKGLIIEKGNRESDEELKKLRDRAKRVE